MSLKKVTGKKFYFGSVLLLSIRPYIIVKKGQPMVKNKHIEDLSQGYR